jgi:hypothetical protein
VHDLSAILEKDSRMVSPVHLRSFDDFSLSLGLEESRKAKDFPSRNPRSKSQLSNGEEVTIERNLGVEFGKKVTSNLDCR